MELIQSFQSLDEDDKGCLSLNDFSKNFKSGFTQSFTKRFFEVYVVHNGSEMTFGEYVFFEIAQNHLSVCFFFL